MKGDRVRGRENNPVEAAGSCSRFFLRGLLPAFTQISIEDQW